MPTEWKVHDDNWLVRQEQLAPDRWLLCFRANPTRPPGDILPQGWVNVCDRRWGNDGSVPPKYLEDHRLDHGGPLELECLAHEMRRKYGA